ncbi:7151_t:CDS:1, partial [Acaulospora colombiana]
MKRFKTYPKIVQPSVDQSVIMQIRNKTLELKRTGHWIKVITMNSNKVIPKPKSQSKGRKILCGANYIESPVVSDG